MRYASEWKWEIKHLFGFAPKQMWDTDEERKFNQSQAPAPQV